jgi:hypothetical protein
MANIEDKIGFNDGGSTTVKEAFRDRRGHGFARGEPQLRNTAVLLNNTAAYHGYRHFGTNCVTSVILDELAKRGLSTIAYANNLRGVAALCDRLKTKPGLVVLNGEGTMHDNHERAIGLLLAAVHLKKWGVPCVLINSLWDRNTSLMASYLDNFDYISTRDSASREALAEATSKEVAVVPDLSLAGRDEILVSPENVAPIGVVDAADDKDNRVIRSFAESFALPFYTAEGTSRASEQGSIERHASTQSLAECAAWVTGRYHFALAALCSGRRFLAVRTRVSKMQGMLADAGLSDFLLETSWLQATPEEKMAVVREKLGAWDEAALERASAYRSTARRAIASSFDHIAGLVK